MGLPMVDTKRTRNWYNKGVALGELGKYEEAIKCYDRAIEIKSNYEQAWYNKGWALGELGKYEEAIKCYDKAIEIKPNYEQAWYNKGVALGKLGKHEEEIKCYDKAIEIKPNYEQAWYNKGVTLGELGKHEEEIKCFDRAIEIKPNYEQAWYNKGVTLGELGKYEEAIKCYDKAIEIKPNDEDAWNNKGWALGKLGKYEEAIKCYDKAIEIKPNYEKAWNNKGVALGKLGKHEEEIKCYDKAIEIKPNYEKAWYNKGVTLGELERYEEAAKYFERAYRLAKGIPVGEYYSPEQAEPTRLERPEIIFQFIEDTKKERVRVALVQLDFSLKLNDPSEDFGYTLEKTKETMDKVFKALSIAEKSKVDIICFPELSVAEEWIKEVKEQFRDLIVVFGTYYRGGFNVCPIIVNGQDYYIQKINPSPHFEKEVRKGRCMKKGKSILVFQTKCGKLAILVCMDYIEEIHRILHSSDERVKNVDFIIVPEYNVDVNLFQEQANQDCRKANFPYIVQANAWRVFEQEVGGTCVIGVDHKSALKRYRMERLKPDDSVEFKLYEAKGETVSILDLDIKRKGVQVPATGSAAEPKMIFIECHNLT
jgi:tetratricopeptide (TPR) repeat protein